MQASAWQVLTTAEGRKYLYNRETKVTTWTEPEAFKQEAAAPQSSAAQEFAGWKEFRSADGRLYYHNKSTGVTTWSEPEEFKQQKQSAASSGKTRAVTPKAGKSKKVAASDEDDQHEAEQGAAFLAEAMASFRAPNASGGNDSGSGGGSGSSGGSGGVDADAIIESREFDQVEDFDTLMAACQEGNLSSINFLLNVNRLMVNGYNTAWWTPVHKAAMGGQPDALQMLIEKKADINAQNEKGTTALILAAYTGDEPPFHECVKLLLAAGADKALVDNYEQTALDYAKEDGHEVTIRLLE